MELNEQEKERIIAEEKLRMKTRKEYFKESFGGGHCGGRWGGGWHGGGCHGYRCGGFGLFKVLIIGLMIFGLFHMWHRPYCGGYPGYYGYPPPQTNIPPNHRLKINFTPHPLPQGKRVRVVSGGVVPNNL